MLWLYLLALVLIGLIIMLLVGRWDGAEIPQEEGTVGGAHSVLHLLQRSAGNIRAEDLEQLRFDSGVRGYRMDQVDALVDALVQQLQAQQKQADSPEERALAPSEEAARTVTEMTSGPSER
ncbi:DivIVA domain-containing protein [Nesterenkonia massiliensis]|uniref:DivIVA domain-containing protein n=1 Tax=Nesterenkonia massiliensis TaxID=1232429 RepID=UPI0005C9950C|nr:DivIVA domain-containing protein [Nesterenkonia massiliensis]